MATLVKTPSGPLSSIPIDSIEVSRDLQRRVGRFARGTFVVAGAMQLATIAADLAQGEALPDLLVAHRLIHNSVLLVLGAVWWLCFRKADLAVGVLEALDATLTIALGVAWAALGLAVSPREPIELTIILATTYTLVVRAVTIPSTRRRTLWISAVAMVPTYAVFVQRAAAFTGDPTPERVRMFLSLSALWCIAAVLISAGQSNLLFGLRARLQKIGKLGQYTLAEKIGAGGMGEVYRATHAFLRRPAAIKLLLPGRASERDLSRFEREVQLTSQLTHPNTISIFDYGRNADGVFYYVMEYLRGFDLDRLVASDGPLGAARAIHILAQVAGALSEAHLRGLVHRDIKPANIMLTSRPDEPDVVKVVDFGLVKTQENASAEAAALTMADAIIGTPLYLAPEAIQAPELVSASVDIYALGAVGYFLLSGKHVFEAASLIETFSKHLTEAPVPPSQKLGARLPTDLEGVILSCLEKSPAARPASAEVLRDALLNCADALRYDVAAAKQWWQDRGDTLCATPTPRDSLERAATMMIDLDR